MAALSMTMKRPFVSVVLATNWPQIFKHALVGQTSVLCDKAFSFCCSTEHKYATDLHTCLGGSNICIV